MDAMEGAVNYGGGNKLCIKCKGQKHLEDFYLKRKELYENTCKTCKKQEVLDRRLKVKLAHKIVKKQVVPRPERIIEPKVSETNFRINNIDFDDLEQFNGRSIDRVEKQDIANRFNEFVGILIDGYRELTGNDIYIES